MDLLISTYVRLYLLTVRFLAADAVCGGQRERERRILSFRKEMYGSSL